MLTEHFQPSKIKLVKTKFTHFQSLKRQEIDMEGNFVESDKATENSDFSKGVNYFPENWSIGDYPWSQDL